MEKTGMHCLLGAGTVLSLLLESSVSDLIGDDALKLDDSDGRQGLPCGRLSQFYRRQKPAPKWRLWGWTIFEGVGLPESGTRDALVGPGQSGQASNVGKHSVQLETILAQPSESDIYGFCKHDWGCANASFAKMLLS